MAKGVVCVIDTSVNVGLQPGQQLQQLSDGSVAIVVPVEGEGDLTPEADPLPAEPSLAERREAITNTQLQQQAGSRLARAGAARHRRRDSQAVRPSTLSAGRSKLRCRSRVLPSRCRSSTVYSVARIPWLAARGSI
jgi:hypothetical protein